MAELSTPFNPAVLSQIPEYAPNPARAQGEALSLASAMQGLETGGVELQQKKQEQKDLAAAKEVLSRHKLDTFEDQTAAAGELTKISPKLGMEFMGKVQTQRKEQQQYELGDLEKASTQADQLGGGLDSVAAQLEQEAKKPGANQAMLDAKTKQLVIPAALQLRQTNPALAQYIDKAMQDPQALTYQGFMNIVGQSKQHRERLTQEIARRREANVERQETERERHDRATEDAASKRAAGAGGGAWSEDEQGLLAALADRSANLPAGSRSQAMQHATIAGLLKRHPGMSVDQIADGVVSGKLKLTGETQAARVAGGQIGKVSLAANELDTFGQQVLQASADLPRGTLGITKNLTINGLIQAGEKQFSDPQLLRLKTKLTALNNAYDQLSARGGTDAEKRAHIHELFDQRLSDEAIQTLVKSLNEEAEGARQAATRTIAETSGAAIPGAQPSAPGTLPGAVPPGAAPGAAPVRPGAAVAPAGGETRTYQGKTYRLKPGTDRTKRENWEVVGSGG